MPTIFGPIDLVKNEIRNAAAQNLGSPPTTPVKGQFYFNTGDNTLYWWDGTVWVPAKATASVSLSSTAADLVVGGASSGGVSTTASKGDHNHALPGWGAVTAETTFGTGSAGGVAGTFARSDHTHGNPTHDAAAHSAIPLSALAVPTAPLNLNSQKIINVADPTGATDGANKQYVDNTVNGLSWKDQVRAATTANITLSGTQTIDGVALAANDRVLVKNQTTASANGVYLCQAGAWTRTTDADVATELESAAVFVSEGTTLADTCWVMTANSPVTVGTTNLTFVQFGAPAAYIGGNGLTLTGNTFDVVGGTGITVAADLVSVDTTVIATQAYANSLVTGVAKKFAAALAGTASPEVVTHNLNTRDIAVTVLNGASPYTAVEVDWDATTVNTMTIRYNPNLGAGYRVVVIG